MLNRDFKKKMCLGDQEDSLASQMLAVNHEDLNSIPNGHVNLGMVAHVCNPSTKEAETGGSLGLAG